MKNIVFLLTTLSFLSGFLSGCSTLGLLPDDLASRPSRFDDDVLATPPTKEPAALLAPPAGVPVSSEQRAILKQDIYLGMSSVGVKASWGEPNEVEFAAESSPNVQRWSYKMVIGTSNGYYAENRVVYFENNRVIGWETK